MIKSATVRKNPKSNKLVHFDLGNKHKGKISIRLKYAVWLT